jgi:hypothetical protein
MPASKTNFLTGLLYLINILQPVSGADLKKQFSEFAKSLSRTDDQPVTYESLLDALERYRLILKIKGRYSVTREGLNRIALAGLSHSRDKNRLFILKDLM